MEVNCAGCAGCCIDWRPLGGDDPDHERRGPWQPLDDTYNFLALTRDEVRAFLESGLGDALTPRLWEGDGGDDGDGLEIDGHHVATVAGRPAFFVGLRKPPKPVAPFDLTEARWLPSCVFLDPTTLQCRLYDDDRFPAECGEYPAHNLMLEVETECERVEDAFGGERLLEDDPGDVDGPLLGPGAIGAKVFVHPRPDDLEGVVERAARDELTRADRAEFLAVAAASSPGTIAVSEYHYERGNAQALEADSWVGEAIDAWTARHDADEPPEAGLARVIEDRRGAPETAGWEKS